MATKKRHIEYHRDGSVWAKGTLLNRKPEGAWQWFRKDGTKMRSGSFKAGIPVGKWTTYDKMGKEYKVTNRTKVQKKTK